MEIAISLLGLALTTLGVVFAYIWRSNGLLQRTMMAGLEQIVQGVERMEQGVERIQQGQREIAQLVQQNQLVLQRLLQDGRQTQEALHVAVEGIRELLQRPAPAS